MAVALLAEEGRLSLDDSVSEHLDGYPDWAEPVTLTQLIHHTSGIPDIEGLMQAEGVWFEGGHPHGTRSTVRTTTATTGSGS